MQGMMSAACLIDIDHHTPVIMGKLAIKTAEREI
jgi:hypothetical protein